MRVLVLEDDALAAAAVAGLVAAAGHEVVGPLSTVQEALAEVRRAPPDLALVDVDLGRGGSGIAAARGLSRHFGVPSVFVTGDVERARDAADAAIALVAKPVDPAALLGAIEMAGALAAGREEGGQRLAPPAGVEVFFLEAARQA
jgi:CheY-like chemotaxis protein